MLTSRECLKGQPPLIFLLLAAIAAGHVASVSFGLYAGYWQTDIILHALAGMMFALVWLSYAEGRVSGRLAIFIATLSFAVSAGFLWEIWEFTTYEFSENPMRRAYVPSLSDTLGDILSSLAGGVLALICRK